MPTSVPPLVASMTARQVIETLGLQAHPEGGWYREYWRGPLVAGRATGTSIYFLLERGQRSHWHRIDASELWLHHAGGPVKLLTARHGAIAEQNLGQDMSASQALHALVEPFIWQSATCGGDWALVSCVVTPGFEFSSFELAPPGWEPDDNT